MKYKITIKPEDFIKESTVYDYRFKLKMELLKKRGYKSDWSGKPISDVTGCHLHEGIIQRNLVPKSIWWHLLIFSEMNSVLLLPEEHIPLVSGLTREWCIQLMYDYYGRDAVREWFYGLPWRSIPFQLL